MILWGISFNGWQIELFVVILWREWVGEGIMGEEVGVVRGIFWCRDEKMDICSDG